MKSDNDIIPSNGNIIINTGIDKSVDGFKKLISAFSREEGFVEFQIKSYNDFIKRRIPLIIKQIKEIKPEVPDLGEFKIKLGKFKIGTPSVKEADGSIREILP